MQELGSKVEENQAQKRKMGELEDEIMWFQSQLLEPSKKEAVGNSAQAMLKMRGGGGGAHRHAANAAA